MTTRTTVRLAVVLAAGIVVLALVGFGRARESGGSSADACHLHVVPVADIVDLYTRDSENEGLLRRAVALTSLPRSWRNHFRQRLWKPDA